MPIETEVVRDTAHFVTHEPRSSVAALLHEVAQVHGSGKVTPFANAHEIGYLNDHVVQSAFSLLHEVARLGDAAFPSLRYDVITRDIFYASDNISSRRISSYDVHELARIHGIALAPPTATLREVARLSDAVHWFGEPQTLHEIGKLKSAAFPSNAARLHEVALLSSHASSHLRNSVVVRELGLLDNMMSSTILARGDLHEVAQVHGWATPRSVRRPVLHETFYIDDWATPPARGRAYTANILTWGMSTYANYPFLTQAGLFAAGNNLWRLDALDDYGVPIQAWITTGRLDMGSSRGKRVTALYAAGSTNEPLTVIVSGDVDGQLAAYTYTLDLRDQTDYRNNRAILGKGFRSRYLQFKLQAAKYLGFRLLTAELDIAASPRRVG